MRMIKKQFPIIDLHEDLMLYIKRRDLYPPQEPQTSFASLEKNNVRVTFATAFPVPPRENFFDPISNDMIEEDFQSYIDHCKTNPQWRIVRNKKDFEMVLATRDAHGLIMHIEGLNVVSDNDWPRLERWYDMGWRSLGIVWNLTNPLGGGTKDATSSLTPLGEKMIRWCQAKNMVVDFAHMNAPTFAAATKIVTGPIMVSHGNSAVCCPNPRNYTDEQLKLVADRGGVVGVFFSKKFVSGEASGELKDVVAHLERFRSVMGIDHVALGTDFGGITSGLVKNLETLDCMGNLWSALAEAKWTDEMMEKVAYKNSERVLNKILG